MNSVSLKQKICSLLDKVGLVWIVVIFVLFILGIVAHYFWSDWISMVFFVLFGAFASAVTVIYAIKEDLSRRASIANPVLELLKKYIINMAINLNLHVVNASKDSSITFKNINDKLNSKDEDAILDGMKALHRDMKTMCTKELTDDEKKAIKEAAKGFCDDIINISKRVDYVLDKITSDDVPEFINYSKILEINKFHIEKLFKSERKIERFERNLLGAYTQSFDMCIKIYKIVVKALKG
jgi:hypothetical protein